MAREASHGFTVALLIGLTLSLATWMGLTGRWPQLALLEAQARDAFFCLRDAAGLHPPLDPRLHLIGLDPGCDRLLRKPTLLAALRAKAAAAE